MHAVRNIRLCTKDCLCLYICPTGATDTETGQIDSSKCIHGCRACVDSCPSHAISLAPEDFPPQQEKTDPVKAGLRSLAKSKVRQEQMAAAIAANTENPLVRQLAQAFSISNRLMAEDLLRESGYMLPQGREAKDLLRSLRNNPQPADFPLETVKILLERLKIKEENKMEKYRCPVCGYIHEGPLPADFKCPRCKQPASAFEKVAESITGVNKYAGTKTEKNLMEGFAGESQARNKYTYFAHIAQREGYDQIAEIFLKTARNEQEHARIWYEELVILVIPRKTFCMRHKGKTMSGPLCMIASPTMPRKKASRNWPRGSGGLAPLKKPMKNAIGPC